MIHKYLKTEPNTWSGYSMRKYIKHYLENRDGFMGDCSVEELLVECGITDDAQKLKFTKNYTKLTKAQQPKEDEVDPVDAKWAEILARGSTKGQSTDFIMNGSAE